MTVRQSKYFIITGLFCLAFPFLSYIEAEEMEYDGPTGTVYFSNGADLIKYNFDTNEETKLFKYREKSELGKIITNVSFVQRCKDKILFTGQMLSKDWLFEADFTLRNWKQYNEMGYPATFSVSPDGNAIAYCIALQKLVIQQYIDLNKENRGLVIANNTNTFIRPLWISNEELLYYSTDKAMIKINITNSQQQVLSVKYVPLDITHDRRYVLCFDNLPDHTNIYLYDLVSNQAMLVKKSDMSLLCVGIFSPDDRYFLFSKDRRLEFSWNIFKLLKNFNDATGLPRDMYVYDLKTNKEIKMPGFDYSVGGFWLANDKDKK